MASSGYGALVSPGMKTGRIDQGIDFLGQGTVFALGSGTVTRVATHDSGWPGEGGLVVYKMDDGRSVYVAEDLVPQVKVGQKVKAGQVVAVATGSGKAPGIEVGWAQENGAPLAQVTGGYKEGQKTNAGKSFAAFASGGQAPAPDNGSATPPPVSAAPTSDQLVQNDPSATTTPPLGPGATAMPQSPTGNSASQLVDADASAINPWQNLASLPGASPDTLRLAQMASYASLTP